MSSHTPKICSDWAKILPSLDSASQIALLGTGKDAAIQIIQYWYNEWFPEAVLTIQQFVHAKHEQYKYMSCLANRQLQHNRLEAQRTQASMPWTNWEVTLWCRVVDFGWSPTEAAVVATEAAAVVATEAATVVATEATEATEAAVAVTEATEAAVAAEAAAEAAVAATEATDTTDTTEAAVAAAEAAAEAAVAAEAATAETIEVGKCYDFRDYMGIWHSAIVNSIGHPFCAECGDYLPQLSVQPALCDKCVNGSSDDDEHGSEQKEAADTRHDHTRCAMWGTVCTCNTLPRIVHTCHTHTCSFTERNFVEKKKACQANLLHAEIRYAGWTKAYGERIPVTHARAKNVIAPYGTRSLQFGSTPVRKNQYCLISHADVLQGTINKYAQKVPAVSASKKRLMYDIAKIERVYEEVVDVEEADASWSDGSDDDKKSERSYYYIDAHITPTTRCACICIHCSCRVCNTRSKYCPRHPLIGDNKHITLKIPIGCKPIPLTDVTAIMLMGKNGLFNDVTFGAGQVGMSGAHRIHAKVRRLLADPSSMSDTEKRTSISTLEWC